MREFSYYEGSELIYPGMSMVANREELVNLRETYRNEKAMRMIEFKNSLFAFHGVLGHPKAEDAFKIAYDERHSFGLEDVANFFDTLVSLLK